MKLKSTTVLILLCIILLGFLYVIDSFNLNTESKDIKKVDAIILLSGNEGRFKEALKLYNEGYANRIIISPISSTNKNSIQHRYMRKYKVNPDIFIEDYYATSTYTNATETKKIMNSYQFDSAIVVTSDYHMKRTRYIFEKEYGFEYELYFSSATNRYGEHWYETDAWYEIWFSEFYKMLGYRLRLYKVLDL